LKCTFFGHSDTPINVESTLKTALIGLIENHGVNTFYVGHQGNFDFLVQKTLKTLKYNYPHINYYMVLAYLPTQKHIGDNIVQHNTLFPDGLEKVPPKYAIDRRNRWMVDNSDYIVTYVRHNTGGAAKFKELAEKRGKTVINLAEINDR